MTTEGMDMEQLNGDMIVYIKQNGGIFNAYGVNTNIHFVYINI